MKKLKPTPRFRSFVPLFFCLQLLFSISFSTLPVDFIIKPSSCNSVSDCPHYRFPKCNGSNQCVQCSTSTDCNQFSSGSSVSCTSALSIPSYKYCEIDCSSSNKEPCRQMRTYCGSSNVCRPCSSDTQCQNEGYPGTTWCDEDAATGVAVCSSCPKTGGCPGTATCQNFKCVECTSNANCPTAKPICEMKFEGNYCKECLEDSHCTTPALSKCSASQTCIKCTADSECAHISGKPKCDATKGCVKCYDHTHCTGGNNYCSATNQCVQCTEDGHCGSGHCVGNICVDCEQDSHCTNPSNPKCTLNTCGPCSNPTTICSDNFPSKPVCSSGGQCVECQNHSDCQDAAKPRCSANTCLPCSDATFCSGLNVNFPQCATTGANAGKCVECLDHSYCTNPAKPRCLGNTCLPCSDATFCTSLPGSLNQCALTGPNTGKCVACISDGNCANPLSKCLQTTTNTCVECVNHIDCIDPTKPRCSGNTCQPCSDATFCSGLDINFPQCAVSGPNTGKCVKCISDGNCANPLSKCLQTTTNTCVECINHIDCTDPTKPRCSGNTCQACSDAAFCSSLGINLHQCASTGPNTGKCVECTDSNQCSGSLHQCSSTSNTCVGCTDSSHCTLPSAPFCGSGNSCQPCPDTAFCNGKYPSSLPFCLTGTCVQCTAPAHCPGSTCSAANTCVGCTQHSDCPTSQLPACTSSTCQSCFTSAGVCASRFPNKPVCLSTNEECVQCETPAHCGSVTGKPECDLTSHTCVECTAHSHCFDPTKPRCAGNICQPCSDAAFCSALNINFPKCAITGPNLGQCVQCVDNTPCFGTTPVCSTSTLNTCVQCADDSHCTNPSAPFCGSANTCQPCPDTPFCAGKYPGNLPYCVAGTCVKCLTPSDCSAPTSYCSSSNTCVGCTQHSECPTAQLPVCSSPTCQSCLTLPTICASRFPNKPACLSTNGECVECETATHCVSVTGKPECSPASHTCVECLTDNHCFDFTKPRCAGNTCQPCSDSAFCTSLPGPLDQCALTGPNTGKCVVCTDNSHCSGTTPVCSTSTLNTCVQCADDSHCTNPSAPFCGSANTCQPCPNSLFCAGKYPGNLPYCVAGTCVKCLAPSDCSAPTSYCSSSNTCVGCTQHSECPTSQLPACTSSTCQSCLTSPGICASRFPNKPVCLSSNGECVQCETSTHCASITGMPECDSVSHTCVECTAHSHCFDPAKPRCAGNICQPCSDAAFCSALNINFPKCATTGPNLGQCVQCVDNTPCFGTTPVCSTSTLNTCVQCTDDSHCTNPSAPFCGSANTCQPCPDSLFCAGKYPGNLPYCVTGTCVKCIAQLDCSAPTPYCSSSNACVECTQPSECPTPQLALCLSLTCQSCTSSPGVCAARFPNKPVCSSGECVECETPAHCASVTGKPQCHTPSKTCVECTAHSHCFDPTKPFCGASNICQPCSTASITFCQTQFSTTHPFCSTTTGACAECLVSPDCLDPTKPNCISDTCQPTIYLSYCSPTYTIQVKQQAAKLNQFDIFFPADLVSKIDIKSTITLTLQSVPPSDYTYALNSLSSTHYQAIFTAKITIPSTKLKLQLPCPTQIGYVFGDIILETPTKSIPLIDPDLLDTIDTIGSITKVTTNVIAGASGSMILAGANPALMWALIGLLQAFYYMIFINVQYPINVQAFFGLFGLGNLPFIPNPIEWFFPEIDGVDLQAPSKFLENDVDGLFLQTAGNMLLTWVLVLTGYLASKFFLKFTRNMPRLMNRGASKMVKMFQWSGVIRTFMTSYTQLSLAAFLQIRVLNFDRKLYGVSSLSGIAFTLFAFVFPPLLVLLIHRFNKYPKIMNTTFSTLTDEFKYDKLKPIPIYFNALFVIRRLFLVLALVFLHDYPYLEVVILILNCVVWLILLLKYLPYEKAINNIVNIISEFLFVIIHVIILLFAHDDKKDWLTDKKKVDLGWIIISCCGIILGLILIVAVIEQYFVIKDLIQLLRNLLSEKNSSSRRMRRKSSPKITEKRTTQNSILHSRNTSTDELDNSMVFLFPLQTTTQQRRRIIRPPRQTTGTNKTPSPSPALTTEVSSPDQSIFDKKNRGQISSDKKSRGQVSSDKNNQDQVSSDKNNRDQAALERNNRRQVMYNHIRDLIMSGKKKGSNIHHTRLKNM